MTKSHIHKGAKSTYWGSISEGITSLLAGLLLTFKHLFQALRYKREPVGVENKDYFSFDKGIVTLQYPHEAIPVPDNGRYRLHNEIDDCIVCDLCAKICPVNCIEIDAIKSTEEIGKTSDGSTKRIYAGTFDIDMAKCCYCGLCTTVCPTECLTMTKTYDYSEFDVRNMVYHFTNLTPDQAEEKKKLYEEKQKEKSKPKSQETTKPSGTEDAKAEEKANIPKPAFKPVIKPPASTPESREDTNLKPEEMSGTIKSGETKPEEKKAAKPVFKPVIKAPTLNPKPEEESNVKPENKPATSESGEIKPEEKKALRPVFKPVIKPSVPKVSQSEEASNEQDRKQDATDEKKGSTDEPKSGEVKKPAKPIFKPVIKPKPKQEGEQGDQ
ncbi:hypothetical protein MYP_278 [Sporocytophaga myxococcoides]|uniref:4Fe-4S ferredoxin-type domain-containing protein n=2 Tax=Sporocytophaga myxococcoides TaxID=153721 RepID=A0A098L8Z1_9BACT|nr:hypothetical protein MYP_278 [Sporocytophaga myxococcoides]